MHANRTTLLAALLLLCCAAAANAGLFTHAGKAYSIDTPFAWRAIPATDSAGRAYHVFTPEWTGDVKKVDRGIWVYAIPIPNDALLNPESAVGAAAAIMKTGSLTLTLDGAKRTEGKLGKVTAWSVPATGKHLPENDDWQGVVHVAFTGENLLILAVGGKPKHADEIIKKSDKALASFIAPIPLKPWNVMPAPKEPARLRDMSDLLKSCTVKLQPLAPSEKDPKVLETISYGTGWFLRPDGYIITNRHVVVRGDARQSIRRPYDPILVGFDQTVRKDTLVADVVAISYQWDLALLKIRSDKKDWPYLRMSDFANVRTGDRIAVIGWPTPEQVDQYNISMNEGSVTRIEFDGSQRARNLIHSARTAKGNSGGPIYSLELDGIVGVMYLGYFSDANGFRETLYFGAVPIDKVVWEFPQVASEDADNPPNLSAEERQALIAQYVAQHRYGAAMMECRKMLEASPKDGVANAYLARIYEMHGDHGRADAALKLALDQPNSKYLATCFAARAAIEACDVKDARQHAQSAMQLKPQDPTGHLLMAHALALTNDAGTEAKLDEVIRLSGGTNAEAEAMLGALPLRRWLAQTRMLLIEKERPIDATLQKSRQHLQRSLAIQPYGNGIARSYLAMNALMENNASIFNPTYNAARKASPLDPETTAHLAYIALMIPENGDPLTLESLLRQMYEARGVREDAFNDFITGFAHLRMALTLGSMNDAQAKAAGQNHMTAATRMLDQVDVGGTDLWWTPLADRLYSVATGRNTTQPKTGPSVTPVPTPVAKLPAAGINTVQQQHGATFNGRVGMIFHIDLDIVYASGRDCNVVVVIKDSLDNPLKGVTKDFTLADGVMGCYGVVKPGGDLVRGHKIRLFMPYDDMQKAGNGNELQYSVAVYSPTDKKWINGNRHQQKLFIPPPDKQTVQQRDPNLSGRLTSVTPKYDVERGGKKGLLLTSDLSIFGGKGRDAVVGFYFSDMRGRQEMPARSKEYSDDKGRLFAFARLKPNDDKYFAKGIEVFVPYEELGVKTEPTHLMYMAGIIVGTQVVTEDQYDQVINGLLQFNVEDRDARRDWRPDPRTTPRVEDAPPVIPAPRDPRVDPRIDPRVTDPRIRKFAFARVGEVKAEAGVTKDGKKGVMITVQMSVFDASGSEVEVVSTFSDSRNRPMAARSPAYSDSRGVMVATTKLKVTDDKFFPKDTQLFIPYSELTTAAGKQSIRYTVGVNRDGRPMASGPRNAIEFTVEAADLK